jgi:hypothetical protein
MDTTERAGAYPPVSVGSDRMTMANHEDPWDEDETPSEASGDTALRQMRRRYEALRHDYEELIDRLSEVEQRLLDEQRASAAQRSEKPGSLRVQSRDFLLAPLGQLRDDYLMIADELITIANSLNDMTARAMKGQRASSAAAGVAPQSPTQPTPQPQHMASGEPQRVNLHVQASGLGQLLDFQEQLSRLTGVERVSISQVNEDRAVLTVELAADTESAGSET